MRVTVCSFIACFQLQEFRKLLTYERDEGHAMHRRSQAFLARQQLPTQDRGRDHQSLVLVTIRGERLCGFSGRVVDRGKVAPLDSVFIKCQSLQCN